MLPYSLPFLIIIGLKIRVAWLLLTKHTLPVYIACFHLVMASIELLRS